MRHLGLLFVLSACGTVRMAEENAPIEAERGAGVDELALERLDIEPEALASAALHERVRVEGTEIELVVLRADWQLDPPEIEKWVRGRAELLRGWLGRSPVPYLFLAVRPSARAKGVGDGFTIGTSVPALRVALGERADANVLARDWVLLHEMVHIAIPNLAHRHHWFEEGAAVYVEPCARLLGRSITREQFWTELARDYPQGAPRKGEGGLDDTTSWGRTYYGGATFFLLTDLAIRERTRGAKTLRDAFRGIVERFHGITNSAELVDVLDAADRATGTTAMQDTYARFGHSPDWVDLEQLWRELGVLRDGRRVKFDDSAPKAWLRQTFER